MKKETWPYPAKTWEEWAAKNSCNPYVRLCYCRKLGIPFPYRGELVSVKNETG